MLRKLIIALLFASLLITHASATEYLADLTLKQIQGSDSKSWVTLSTRTLNPGGTWDVGSDGSLIIKYTEKAPYTNQITFSFSGTSISTPFSWAFDKGHTECIRGTCNENATNSSSNAVRLTLTDIRASTTASSFNGTTSDDLISAYANVNGKPIPIPKDNMRTIDVQKTIQETGVSDTKVASEIKVYFTRKEDVDTDISVKAESRAPKYMEMTPDKTIYTIDSSGTYTFTVKYKKKTLWGYTEITEVYGLKLINLGDATSTTGGVTKYKTTVYLPDMLTVDMGTAGNFTDLGGISITKLSGSEYRLSFNSAGTYKLRYTTSGGTAVDDAVTATVRDSQPTAKPTETPVEEKLTGNEQQDGGGGSDWWIYGIVLLALLGIIGYSLTRKKGKSMYVNNNPD